MPDARMREVGEKADCYSLFISVLARIAYFLGWYFVIEPFPRRCCPNYIGDNQ
jgi:hypothetical protein